MEQHLDEFKQAGVQPVAISVDTPEESRDLSNKAGYTFPILSDRNAAGDPQLRSAAQRGGRRRPRHRASRRVPRRSQRHRALAQSDRDFRVRATPEQILDQVRSLH